MSLITIDFRLDRFRNKQGHDVFVYVPIIDLVLHSTHKYTPKIGLLYRYWGTLQYFSCRDSHKFLWDVR